MEQKSSGIILRTRRFTETSLIAEWLTPAAGRVQTLAKGALRPKSNFRGKLDLYFEGEFTYQPARSSTLHNLREVKVTDTNEWLRRNLRALEQAAYATSLIELTTEPETPLDNIYPLFLDYLEFLKTSSDSPLATTGFEAKLLQINGLTPNLDKAAPNLREIMNTLLTLDFSELRSITLTREQALDCHRFFHGFIIYHCGKLPRNRPAV